MMQDFLSFLSQKKTLLFLIMCFFVHGINAVVFYFLGFFPLAILNVLSATFYAAVLKLFKRHTDVYIIFTYFEIITFSFISELFSGGSFLYIFFVVGMISTVFYLLPPNKRMKHIFQGIGILYAIAIYIIRIKHFALFPQYESIVESYKYQIGFF